MWHPARLQACLLLLFSMVGIELEAAEVSDLVTDLPGISPQPSFKQYSGYLSGTGQKRLHYWFVESANNPSTDPVALWLNGGPGCSSLFGLLNENGPLLVQSDGTSLAVNPYAWNTVANVLYLESPAGVGFSYSPNTDDYVTDDNATALSNLAAVKDFFAKFPEYLSNELYITGESYGGIYVPMLTNLLLQDSGYNLKGFAVGNGVSNQEFMGDSLMYFAYFHGLIGTEQWRRMVDACCGGVMDNCQFMKASKQSKTCFAEADKVNQIIDSGAFDAYNLFAPCAGGVLTPDQAHYKLKDWVLHFSPRSPQITKSQERLNAEQSCNDNTALINYLNLPAVRSALHIPTSVQKWINCAEYRPGWYTKIYNDTAPFYRTLLNAGIRGLMYNGDVDMVCNFLGDEWFVDSLQRKVTEERKMWYYHDQNNLKQVAGFVKTFDLITYATVRGSGHMVPKDRPRPALVLFSNLVQNKPFLTL